MSRHSFRTSLGGQAVQVIVGWDNALQQRFMDVWSDTDEDRPLYTYLSERRANLTTAHFQDVLANLCISVPPSIFDQLEEDATRHAGNRIVEHFANGSFKELR